MSPAIVSLRRIVLAMEGSGDPDRIIEASTLLARVLGAEIAGVFVEEDALLDLSGLPFARALTGAAGPPVAITPEAMRRALARAARTYGEALTAQAGRANIKCSFATSRGSLAATLSAQAGTGDVIALDVTGQGRAALAMLGELRRTSRAAGAILINAGRAGAPAGPVLAVDDGDPAGAVTVRMAAMLARALNRRLRLVAYAEGGGDSAAILARARDIVSGIAQGMEVTVQAVTARSPEELRALVAAAHPLFVVGDLEGRPFNDDEAAQALVAAAGAPVLLLRNG